MKWLSLPLYLTSCIYVFAVSKAVLNNGHKLFDDGNNRKSVGAGCLCGFTRYFCFCHNPLDQLILRLQSYEVVDSPSDDGIDKYNYKIT